VFLVLVPRKETPFFSFDPIGSLFLMTSHPFGWLPAARPYPGTWIGASSSTWENSTYVNMKSNLRLSHIIFFDTSVPHGYPNNDSLGVG